MVHSPEDNADSSAAPPAHPDSAAVGWGLCEAFMTELPVSGAVISIVDAGGRRSTISATDPVAARLDELDLELGTGPLSDAISLLAPQLYADVRQGALNPIMGAHLERLDIRAVFALPVTMGAVTVGVVGLYRTTPGTLSPEEVRLAGNLARALAVPAVRAALTMAGREGPTAGSDQGPAAAPELRREVHQATGMISAQLDVSTTEAFARLRAFAMSSERSISAIARDVVDGVVNFLDLDSADGS